MQSESGLSSIISKGKGKKGQKQRLAAIREDRTPSISSYRCCISLYLATSHCAYRSGGSEADGRSVDYSYDDDTTLSSIVPRSGANRKNSSRSAASSRVPGSSSRATSESDLSENLSGVCSTFSANNNTGCSALIVVYLQIILSQQPRQQQLLVPLNPLEMPSNREIIQVEIMRGACHCDIVTL